MSTCACGRPVEDAVTCMGCSNRFAVDLGDVPVLAVELNTVIGRQTVYAERVGSRSSETPAFINERASNLRAALRNTLGTWCRLTIEERYATPVAGAVCSRCRHSTCVHIRRQQSAPKNTLGSMAGWLLGEVEWLRHHPAGHDACDEVGDLINQIRHIIDAPANRTTFPVGPCPEEPCVGEVRAYFPADLTIRPSMRCTVDDSHRWESQQWARAGERILRRKASLTQRPQPSLAGAPTGPSAVGSLTAG